jgi:hypothetical protein
MATAKRMTKKKTSARKCGPKKCATKKAASKNKVAARKTATRKAAAPTATDQVLKVIKRFKKGVSVPAIRERTGLKDKQIRNIVTRAHKNGKIKRVDRGLYAGL